jgi:hypothetical protein
MSSRSDITSCGSCAMTCAKAAASPTATDGVSRACSMVAAPSGGIPPTLMRCRAEVAAWSSAVCASLTGVVSISSSKSSHRTSPPVSKVGTLRALTNRRLRTSAWAVARRRFRERVAANRAPRPRGRGGAERVAEAVGDCCSLVIAGVGEAHQSLVVAARSAGSRGPLGGARSRHARGVEINRASSSGWMGSTRRWPFC